MSVLRRIWIELSETLLRVLPFPCKTGLVRIGSPTKDSPVLLTGNFRLTVERVRRQLRGMDVYLLVANSRGVNVWCAATGGLLSDHDAIAVLKTSGIEQLVDHRQVILPQLAATGIDASAVQKKTGWNVVWGPVQAAAIPAFLRGGLAKTTEMRQVRFPWAQRLEIAIAWAFPISLVASLLVAPFWWEGVLPLVGVVWGLSLALFLSLPLCDPLLRPTGKDIGLVFFNFGDRGVAVLLWIVFVLAFAAFGLLAGRFAWDQLLRWSTVSLVVILVLSIDLAGSTPIYKSGLHRDRWFRITLDEDLCEGAGTCIDVCPTDVLELDHEQRLARVVRGDQCVRCGACIVQCPVDALYLEHPSGEVVTPATVRRFKLNLLGTRSVDLGRSKRESLPE